MQELEKVEQPTFDQLSRADRSYQIAMFNHLLAGAKMYGNEILTDKTLSGKAKTKILNVVNSINNSSDYFDSILKEIIEAINKENLAIELKGVENDEEIIKIHQEAKEKLETELKVYNNTTWQFIDFLTIVKNHPSHADALRSVLNQICKNHIDITKEITGVEVIFHYKDE